MDWQKELDELRRREALAERLGGPERVKRQHDGGRSPSASGSAGWSTRAPSTRSARSPAGRPTTSGTTSSDFTPSNFVFGRGEVDGRPVVVGGDDFTVRGGSADATIKGKHNMCERMAHELRLPLIRLVDGSGGGGSVKTIETTGRANVPGGRRLGAGRRQHGHGAVVALGLGSVAGLGAAHLAAAHYSVMVKDTSELFVAGPPVVERLGQKLTKNELGGWEIQLKAGAVDDAVDTEDEAFARARRFLSYLPRRSTSCRRADRATDDPRAARALADRGDPARRPQAVQDARDRRSGRRPRLVLRESRALGPRRHHRLRALRRLAGGADGERSVLLRRRVDRRRLPEDRALRRSRADVPPARRLPRRLPRLPHRPRRRAERHHQAGRARDGGDLADDACRGAR